MNRVDCGARFRAFGDAILNLSTGLQLRNSVSTLFGTGLMRSEMTVVHTMNVHGGVPVVVSQSGSTQTTRFRSANRTRNRFCEAKGRLSYAVFLHKLSEKNPKRAPRAAHTMMSQP